MSDKIARMKAELAHAELEEAFRLKKANGTATKEDKDAMRAAREAYRLNVRQPVTDGAAPAPIGAKAEVKS